MVDRRALRFLSQGAAVEPCRDGPGDRAMPALSETTSPTSAPASSWARAARRPTHDRGGRRHHPHERQPEARRAVRGAEGDVVDRFGDARDLVQDQGRQLFDLVGLLDLGALHRQRLRADPVGQAGRDVRGRPRGARLDDVEPVRRDGRDVDQVQRPAPATASRAYDIDRDGFVIAGGAGVLVARGTGARQGARREDLCRDRRLWRDVGRLRHGGAVGRRRDALHAPGAGDRQGPGRLHQHARHLDAGRRHPGDERDPRGVRRQMPHDHLDQIADRPFARRRRRAGSDLFDPR